MPQPAVHKWRNATQREVQSMPQDVFLAIYAHQEDINAHSENLLLQAKRFGTPEQVTKAEEILKLHMKKGYLDGKLHNRSRELSRTLNSFTIHH